MSDLEIINDVIKLFSQFQDHSRFFIRERLYKGTPSLGGGLVVVHEQMKKLIEKSKLNPVPAVYLQMKKVEFERHIDKLTKTLDMLLLVAQKEDIHPDEFIKIISIIEMEIMDLDEYLLEDYNFDPNSVQSDKERAILQIDDLKMKIEDNLDQLSLSSEWRRLKFSEVRENDINLDELQDLIKIAKKTIEQIPSINYLSVLSIMATKIRDIAGRSIYELKPLLQMLTTTSKIFLDDIEIEFEGSTISANDVKEEVEHRINLLNINWLAKVHNSIINESSYEDPTNDFAILLYMLSRNKREELRWTISQIVKEGKNSELALIFSDYHKLLSILLQLNENIRQAGLKDIYNAINTANDTDPLDLIDFNSILQSTEEIIVLKFIEAIRNQLTSLKSLALQIIQMEDIMHTFQMIAQFTDLESNLDKGRGVEHYIESLGKSID